MIKYLQRIKGGSLVGKIKIKKGEKGMCGNCIYCEYKQIGESHPGSNGKDRADWWCWMYNRWLGNPSGKCKHFVQR